MSWCTVWLNNGFLTRLPVSFGLPGAKSAFLTSDTLPTAFLVCSVNRHHAPLNTNSSQKESPKHVNLGLWLGSLVRFPVLLPVSQTGANIFNLLISSSRWSKFRPRQPETIHLPSTMYVCLQTHVENWQQLTRNQAVILAVSRFVLSLQYLMVLYHVRVYRRVKAPLGLLSLLNFITALIYLGVTLYVIYKHSLPFAVGLFADIWVPLVPSRKTATAMSMSHGTW